MKLRYIQTANDSGEREEIIFTEDFDSEPEDYCSFDLKVLTDIIIDIDLPDGFPLEYTLKRS